MTTVTTLHAGHDVTYLTAGQHAGGCAGTMSYYTAAGEPPGQWTGNGAASLGLTGQVDPAVIARLYQHNVGPSGELLVTRRQSKAAGGLARRLAIGHRDGADSGPALTNLPLNKGNHPIGTMHGQFYGSPMKS